MFTKLREQQSKPATEPLATRDRFLATLERFEQAKAWFKQQRANGKPYIHMIPKFQALERSVDYLWQKLPEETREAILAEMVRRGELPDNIIQIIKDFNGTLRWV